MSLPVFDALVIGAGPAGCAAAIALRVFGRRVAILERERQPPIKVGEHIRPEAIAELAGLQLSSAGRTSVPCRRAAGFARLGVPRSCASETTCSTARGSSWNVARHALESELAQRSVACGATLMRGRLTTETASRP